MKNGDRVFHPKLKVYGNVSMLEYTEDGKQFFAVFKYRDPKTGRFIEIEITDNDFKKEE